MRGKNAWLTSLRRHYPHQVQGVVHHSDLSAIRLPRTYFSLKIRRRDKSARVLARRTQRSRRHSTKGNLFLVLKLASAPSFARCYPRSFAFYVANPIRSILCGLCARQFLLLGCCLLFYVGVKNG